MKTYQYLVDYLVDGEHYRETVKAESRDYAKMSIMFPITAKVLHVHKLKEHPPHPPSIPCEHCKALVNDLKGNYKSAPYPNGVFKYKGT